MHRFVDILLKTGAPVSELVAITYTEKAASELRRKVAEEVEARLRAADDASSRMSLERIRDQLTSVSVGTIHSFCARLLREFPVEADVDAGFTVVEGIDRQALQADALREALEAGLRLPGEEQTAILDAVRMLGRKRVEGLLGAFLNDREKIQRIVEPGGLLSGDISDSRILEQWDAMLLAEIQACLDASGWHGALLEILPHARGRSLPEISPLITLWPSLTAHREKIDQFDRILTAVLTGRGELRKDFIGRGPVDERMKRHEATLANVRKLASPLIAGLRQGGGNNGNAVLLSLLKTLLNLYRKAVEIYDGKKLESGQLDFEDLQLKAEQLLRNEALREAIQSRIRFMMVDEFQDTNRLQDEILRLLVPEEGSLNLFIVGDPKQSIYGFRDAEVSIFSEVRNRIVNDLGGSGVELEESFRLLPNIIDFIDRIFSRAMGKNATRYDVPYKGLVQGRNNTAEGAVELLLVPVGADATEEVDAESKGNRIEPVERECRLVARRITELADGHQSVFAGKDERPKTIEFRDIAILLRSRTHAPVLERALSELSIPYLLSGGIGFYQTQEVLDFINYFRFLLNADDDVALAGILRSPLFGISDAALFEISLLEGASFWEKARSTSKPGSAPERFRRAVEILSQHRALANRLPIPNLVNRIFADTGWRGAVAGLPDGDQIIANVDKVIDLAREFQGRGFATLYDFVERLKTLSAHESREGQAPVDNAGNCVQIMTIHAAKGLEFPIVFVPFADRRFPAESGPFIDPEAGVAFRVKEARDLNTENMPGLERLLRLRAMQKSEAEEKRIFYVACTRARDMLVISGRWNPLSRYPSHLRWVIDSIEAEDMTVREGELVFPPSTLRVLGREPSSSSGTELLHRLRMAVRLSGGEQPAMPSLPSIPLAQMETRPLFVQPVEGRTKGEFYSATQIRTFFECPTKYYLRYRLGIPENNLFPWAFDEDAEPDDEIRGDVEGIVTHAILQNLRAEPLSSAQIDASADRFLKSMSPEVAADSTRAEIVKNIMLFQESPFGKTVLAGKDARTEYAVSATFDEDFLTGTIDRLFIDEAGAWHILDYKTDRVGRADLSARTEVYKTQIAFYALLVHRLTGRSPVAATLLFLRHADQPFHFSLNDQDLGEFAQRLRSAIADIRAGNFERRETLCASCPYAHRGACVLPRG